MKKLLPILLVFVLASTALGARHQRTRRPPPRRPPATTAPIQPRPVPLFTATELRVGALPVRLRVDNQTPLLEASLQVKALTDIPSPTTWALLSAAMLRVGGIEGLPGAAFADALVAKGLALQIDTAPDHLTVRVSGSASQPEAVLEVLSGLMYRPAMPGAELTRTKEQLRQWSLQRARQPLAAVADRLNLVLFGEHPFANRVEPTVASIITVEDMIRLHKRQFQPERAILSVSSPLEAAALQPLLKKHFSTATADGVEKAPAADHGAEKAPAADHATEKAPAHEAPSGPAPAGSSTGHEATNASAADHPAAKASPPAHAPEPAPAHQAHDAHLLPAEAPHAAASHGEAPAVTGHSASSGATHPAEAPASSEHAIAAPSAAQHPAAAHPEAPGDAAAPHAPSAPSADHLPAAKAPTADHAPAASPSYLALEAAAAGHPAPTLPKPAPKTVVQPVAPGSDAVVAAGRAYVVNSPLERAATQVLAQVLERNLKERLSQLKEAGRASVLVRDLTGVGSLEAYVSGSKLPLLRETLRVELARAASGSLGEAEILDARALVLARVLHQRESVGDILELSARDELLRGAFSAPALFLDALRRLGPEEVRQRGRSLLAGPSWVMVVGEPRAGKEPVAAVSETSEAASSHLEGPAHEKAPGSSPEPSHPSSLPAPEAGAGTSAAAHAQTAPAQEAKAGKAKAGQGKKATAKGKAKASRTGKATRKSSVKSAKSGSGKVKKGTGKAGKKTAVKGKKSGSKKVAHHKTRKNLKARPTKAVKPASPAPAPAATSPAPAPTAH